MARTETAPTAVRHGVLLAGTVLTGMSMRTAVGSVGAVLDEVEHGLGASAASSGLITTLPVVCFAALGSVSPALARRFGNRRVLAVALLLMTAGLLARLTVDSVAGFVLLSVPALCGAAAANVLMPALVKAEFPGRVGPMSAVYTTALAVGLTGSTGLTVPIAHAGGSWRWGLGAWAALSALGVLPWLATWRGDRPTRALGRTTSLAAPARSRTAWALMLMFAGQSYQAYVGYGWFPTFLRDQGVSAGTAGALVAVFAAMAIPTSIVVPSLAARGQRVPILVLGLCGLLGYVGLLTAPAGGAVVWMVLCGLGGGAFPLVLTMISLHTRDVGVTAAASGFVQGIGYILAGTGPLLTGVLHGSTGGWGWPFALLFVALAVSVGGGLYAAGDRTVDDDLDLYDTARAGVPA